MASTVFIQPVVLHQRKQHSFSYGKTSNIHYIHSVVKANEWIVHERVSDSVYHRQDCTVPADNSLAIITT